MYCVCNNKNVSVSIADNFNISIILESKESPKTIEYLAYFYDDELRMKLLMVAKISLICHKSIEVIVHAGETRSLILTLDGKYVI